MTTLNKVQQGFTLIELMIVVAIIGILAAIAIPAYSDYIARSQTAEAITLLGGLKVNVEETYATRGQLPTIASLAADNVKIKGKYVSTMSKTNGVYTATMKPSTSNVNASIAGKTVNFTYATAGGGSWTCSKGTIDNKYLPSSCK